MRHVSCLQIIFELTLTKFAFLHKSRRILAENGGASKQGHLSLSKWAMLFSVCLYLSDRLRKTSGELLIFLLLADVDETAVAKCHSYTDIHQFFWRRCKNIRG